MMKARFHVTAMFSLGSTSPPHVVAHESSSRELRDGGAPREEQRVRKEKRANALLVELGVVREGPARGGVGLLRPSCRVLRSVVIINELELLRLGRLRDRIAQPDMEGGISHRAMMSIIR